MLYGILIAADTDGISPCAKRGGATGCAERYMTSCNFRVSMPQGNARRQT